MGNAKNPRKLPTQSRAQATVDAILIATDELAAKTGIESLTVTGIARRAGVSNGTLYQYFGSLEAVTAAWEERGFANDAATFVTFLHELIEQHLEMEDAIRRTVEKAVDLVMHRIGQYREHRADFVSRFVERVRLAKVGVAAVVRTLEAAPDRGRILVTDLETAAYLLFVSVVSVSYDLAVTGSAPEAIQRVKHELGSMAIGYLLRP
jgi:AcrR family transcriptional regulator